MPPNQLYPNTTSATPPIVGTEIAGPGTILQPLPTGVLLLTQPDDEESFERNIAVCEAFFRTLPAANEVRAEAPTAPNIIATRWLNAGPTIASSDCWSLVNHYDYQRAARLIRRIRMEGRKGPFFAGFLGGAYIAVDGSSYDTVRLGDFVSQWARAILIANGEYAKLAIAQVPILVQPVSTQPSITDLPGPALILFGILKTAAQLVFAVVSVFAG
jgi:hypothetical protein